MSKTLFHFAKVRMLTLIGAVVCILTLSSVQQASASGFGVSLNLGGTSVTLGFGDAKPATPVPTVIAQEPAYVPPAEIVPGSMPRPRFVRRSTPQPVPPKRFGNPAPGKGAPVIRSQAPEKARKAPGKYSPAEAARVRR